MKIHYPASFDALPPHLALSYVRALAERARIGNVHTRMALLETGRHLFPVSVNDGGEHPENCYVVSPLTAYTGYANDELRRLDHPWAARPLRRLVSAIEGLLKAARIDRIAQVNNWLLSTNLYPPDWEGAELPELTALLRQEFPDRAFGFRSLNGQANSGLLRRLRRSGYETVPSRQVYLFDGRAGPAAPFLRRHNCRIDADLLAKSPYRRVPGSELQEADFARIEHLYNLLYLEKYCRLNPHYGAGWLRCGQRDGWLELTALRTADGRIDGAVGWFSTGSTLSAPIVGYDTALPQRTGLYRQLTQLCLQEAARRRVVLNFSSGAAHFKRLRGGQPAIEYSMVFTRHLPAGQRAVWRALGTLLRGIAIPLMRKLKL